MGIAELRNLHEGEPAFCLGTAPHLNELDLQLLKNQVTIATNQLAKYANQYSFDYVCVLSDRRFSALAQDLSATGSARVVIPESLLRKHSDADTELPEAIPVKTRFASPGHAEFFSFDLENCLYAGDVVAMAIQLAVWMGCRPIYVLGVDAKYQDKEQPFFDDSINEVDFKTANEFWFPDLREWLKAVKTRLWARGIKLLDASGEVGSLDVLPKVRLRAAAGKPRVAVTSKTFCRDEYLVKELKRFFPDVKLNESKDKLAGEKLAEFLADADATVLGTEPFSADVIEKLSCLRFVSKYGVGVNNVDFEACKRNMVEVAYRKGTNSDSVSELTLAFALMLMRRMDHSIQSYRDGKWAKLEGREFAEMTVGVIGYGHVGKVVAQKFAALGASRLLVNDLLDFPFSPPAEFVPLDYLLAEADLVSAHVSMEDTNCHLAGKDFFAKMKPGSFFINTSRGEVVDEEALVAVLTDGRLAGAALDVYEFEPEINAKLQSCPNLLTTCHMAGSSNRSIKNMGWAAIEGLLELLGIEPT